MSAFLVSDDHINAMLTPLLNDGRETTLATLQRYAETLQAANLASVRHRYSHNEDYMRELEATKPIKFKRYTKPISPVMVLKLCQCFDYQACEPDDYEGSQAAKLVNSIRSNTICDLEGYEEAPWTI